MDVYREPSIICVSDAFLRKFQQAPRTYPRYPPKKMNMVSDFRTINRWFFGGPCIYQGSVGPFPGHRHHGLTFGFIQVRDATIGEYAEQEEAGPVEPWDFGRVE